MIRFFIISCVLVALTQTAVSQEKNWMTGAELRAYPAGLVPAIVVGYLPNNQTELALSAGMNITNRRDWGEHENEEGRGFGGGLRYTYFFRTVDSGWFAGGVADLWRLEIDWEEGDNTSRGMSNITVLQPTARGGYRLQLDERFSLDTSVALGAEINISTDGEDVGQGAILLLGLQLTF